MVRIPPKKQTATQQTKKIAHIATTTVERKKKLKEIRFLVNKSLFTSVLADGFMQNTINSIAQGYQLNQRMQDGVRVLKIKIKASLQNNSTIKGKSLRVMVVREKNQIGTTLDVTNWTNLYQDSAFAIRTADLGPTDLTSPINTDLLTVMFDKNYNIPIELTSNPCLHINKTIKKPFISNWSLAGTAASPTSGRCFIIFELIDGDSVVSATTTKLNCHVRVFFKNI